MHPFSVLTLGIFVAGYITARWDLVTRLYELAIFAWDHGVVVSAVVAASRWPLRAHLKLGYMRANGFQSLTPTCIF
jgi:phosphatidylinositol glycan class Q protein